MTVENDLPIRVRQEGWKNGVQVLAYACGKNACDDAVFQARLLGWKGGEQVYGFASECREWPLEWGPLEFVLPEFFPPYGLPRKLQLNLFLSLYPELAECFGSVCPETILTYQGGTLWTGQLATQGGQLFIELEPIGEGTGTGSPGPEFRIRFYGCIGTGDTGTGTGSGTGEVQELTVFTNCRFPAMLGGQGLFIRPPPDGYCCPEIVTSSQGLAFSILGYHGNVLPARLKGYAPDGTPIYVRGKCCGPLDCYYIPNCCECDGVPFTWGMTVAGITNGGGPPFPGTTCNYHNGTFTLTYYLSLNGECFWESETLQDLGLAPGTGHTPIWSLRCDNAARRYVLSTQLATGGAATYVLGFDDWNCLGENVMNRFFATAHCSNWPATITLTPG